MRTDVPRFGYFSKRTRCTRRSMLALDEAARATGVEEESGEGRGGAHGWTGASWRASGSAPKWGNLCSARCDKCQLGAGSKP